MSGATRRLSSRVSPTHTTADMIDGHAWPARPQSREASDPLEPSERKVDDDGANCQVAVVLALRSVTASAEALARALQ